MNYEKMTLKSDVTKVVEKISPYIPFLGFLSGGITIAKHVYSHKSKSSNSPEDNKDPSNSPVAAELPDEHLKTLKFLSKII